MCLGLKFPAVATHQLADSIHLKQSVTLYLFSLPFILVKELGWATVPIVTVVAFTFMGIESIADIIEMPFGMSLHLILRSHPQSRSTGNDSADLPLDIYLHDLKEEILCVLQRSDGYALNMSRLRYLFYRLPEGGQGMTGYDDGEGDD